MRKRQLPQTISNVVAYARVSTTEQAERDLSIPAQLEAIRRFAADRGYTVAKEYVEAGASGTDANRKVFRLMLEELLAPGSDIQAVLVYHTSRFMRDVEQARVYKNTLLKNGIRVIAIQQPTSDDPTGHLMEGLFELFDQYESEINGIRTTAAMRENARRGFFNGSQAPFGFAVEHVEVGPGIFKRKLVRSPDEAPLVQQVFDAYVEAEGALRAAEELNRRGIRYRSAKPWSKDLVLKVIGESACVGTYEWGKRGSGDVVPISVEPIVERTLFDIAQQLRESRDPARHSGRTGSSPLLLAGLVRCGQCGAAYMLRTSGRRTKDHPDGFRYYDCRTASRAGKGQCEGGAIPEHQLDTLVLEHLADRLFTPQRVGFLLNEFLLRREAGATVFEAKRKALKAEISKLQNAKARWIAAFEAGEAIPTVGTARLAEIEGQLTRLQTRLSTSPSPAAARLAVLGNDAPAAFQRLLKDRFVSGENSFARSYLRMLIERIVVYHDRVEIRAKPPSDPVAPVAASS